MTVSVWKATSAVATDRLNVRGMSKNHCLASAILDGGFSEFRRQLTYKADWYGSQVVVADRFFANSKICSGCGCKKATLKLSERQYHCDECGFEIDRDLNAAINLRNYPTASYAGVACGATNHPTDLSGGVAMKPNAARQEANGSLSHRTSDPVQICVSLV